MATASLPDMPCGPILELNGQRKRFHVPYGLKQLMDTMIRNVLKDQPENVYEYLACFMEDRVRVKEDEMSQKNRSKSWQVHRWSWEGSSLLSDDEFLEFLHTLKTSFSEAEHYATVIQAAFRGHVTREKVKGLKTAEEHVQDVDENNIRDASDDNNIAFDDTHGTVIPDYEEEDEVYDEDVEEDYTESHEQDEAETTDEEFESEVETASEVEELAEEIALVSVKSSSTKFQLEQLLSANEEADESEEEENEDEF